MNHIYGRGNPAKAPRYWTVEPHRQRDNLYLEVNLNTPGHDVPFTLVVRKQEDYGAVLVPSWDTSAVTGEFAVDAALEAWLRIHTVDDEDIFTASFRNDFLMDQLEKYLTPPLKRVVETHGRAYGLNAYLYGDFSSPRDEFSLALEELIAKLGRAPHNIEKRMKRITKKLEG